MQRDSLTFKAWTVFLAAFPEDIDQHRRFRVPLLAKGPSYDVQLERMSTHLGRLEFNCLTLLCIRDAHFDFKDLMQLLPISTLAGLILHRPRQYFLEDHAVTPHDVNNWLRAAHEKGAFKRLNILHLCGFILCNRYILPQASLFPALNILGLTYHGCEKSGKLHVSHGWESIDPSWYVI